MLRFGQQTTEKRRYNPNRERWRMWLMFGAACAVLWCIRFLQRPGTVERLDTIFNAIENADGQSVPRDGFEIVPVEEVVISPPQNPQVSEKPPAAKVASLKTPDLSAIRDNTYFRSEENPAWFALWESVRQGKSTRESIDEVTYAQLLAQPDAYRGKLVTVRGTAMREELLEAPANEIGIERYHRLILRPVGGGNWPIIIYALELPEKFPRGESIRAEVSATGYFFKNWSYAWQDGLGLAPVVMANSVSWTPVIVNKRPSANISARDVALVIVAAAGLAALVGYLAWKQSRRSPAELERDVVISLPPSHEEHSHEADS